MQIVRLPKRRESCRGLRNGVLAPSQSRAGICAQVTGEMVVVADRPLMIPSPLHRNYSTEYAKYSLLVESARSIPRLNEPLANSLVITR